MSTFSPEGGSSLTARVSPAHREAGRGAVSPPVPMVSRAAAAATAAWALPARAVPPAATPMTRQLLRHWPAAAEEVAAVAPPAFSVGVVVERSSAMLQVLWYAREESPRTDCQEMESAVA